LCLAIFLFFGQAAFAQSGVAWRDGLSRDDVVKALGEPQGDLQNSGGERMIYPNGLLIVLENNVVTEIDGAVPEALKPVAVVAAPVVVRVAAPAASVPADASTPAPAFSTTPKPVAPAATATTVAGAGVAGATGTGVSPAGEQESEKIINDFSTNSIVLPGTPLSGVITKALGPKEQAAVAAAGSGTDMANKLTAMLGGSADAGSPWADAGKWQGFLAGLVLKGLAMTLVLKAAFAYKDFPLLWPEAALVAYGTALCDQVMSFLFSFNDWGKIAQTVQADQIIAGMVLLALIMKFTGAKSFPTAAGIMVVAIGANTALQMAQAFLF
ncbi:MAG TPA: hypothetical protein VK737_01865, partial [Opitutales bacterium]|nr:hypothetical protein [Opitutales bacterium]